MSVCHQAYNIPWSVLQDHLRILGPTSVPTRTRTNFYPRNRPNQEKDVKYFAKKLAGTIREFAQTRRAKYGEAIEIDAKKVIPDDMIGLEIEQDHHVHAEQQHLSWWRAQAPNFGTVRSAYYPAILRELIFRDHTRHLLFLAQQLGDDLRALCWVSRWHSLHFGTDRAYEDALRVYITINVYLLFDLYGTSPAIPHPASPASRSTFSTTSTSDKPEGPWPHALTSARFQAGDDLECSDEVTDVYDPFFENNNDYLQDISRIKGFLKNLFRVLCVSDMYIRECGGDEIDWERAPEDILREDFNFNLPPREL